MKMTKRNRIPYVDYLVSSTTSLESKYITFCISNNDKFQHSHQSSLLNNFKPFTSRTSLDKFRVCILIFKTKNSAYLDKNAKNLDYSPFACYLYSQQGLFNDSQGQKSSIHHALNICFPFIKFLLLFRKIEHDCRLR